MKPKLILVTGASSGIGASVARKLFHDGFQVLLTARNNDRLRALQAELKASPVFQCDLQKLEEIKALTDFVFDYVRVHDLDLFGLVNNAGIFIRGATLEASVQDWQTLFSTNLLAPVELAKRLYPLLKKCKGSSVVNISSTLGHRPVATTAAYSALKAALINWTETLALEWAKDGIRANVIAPGLVDTPIHPFHNDEAGKQQFHKMQPLQRMGRPEDIAEAVAFLLSEKSSWTTGSVFHVDGGIHL